MKISNGKKCKLGMKKEQDNGIIYVKICMQSPIVARANWALIAGFT